MAWPSPRRIAFCTCVITWLGTQVVFFLPPKCSGLAFILPSKQGDFQIFQSGRQAIMAGAFSDRYQGFPKMELIPLLKKRGVREIRNLILTGHDKTETGALAVLQENFKVIELSYPSDSALRMRKTFQAIRPDVRLKRLPEGLRTEKTFLEMSSPTEAKSDRVSRAKGRMGS